MSKKYAIIDNNIVVEILDLDEETYKKESLYHNMVIDIDFEVIQPEIGWVLEGNKLVPASATMTPDERDQFQQKAQRIFGAWLATQATDKIGARNLKLTRENTPIDIAALAGQMLSIKILLEGGALRTVRGICTVITPSFPHHADILGEVIAEITNFINNNGF